MFLLEWLQHKHSTILFTVIGLLLVGAIGYYEYSLYQQTQVADATATEWYSGTLALVKKTRNKKALYAKYPEVLLDVQEQHALATHNAAAEQKAVTPSFVDFTHYFSPIIRGQHAEQLGFVAGEVQATRHELMYLQKNHITAMFPIAFLANPKTAESVNPPLALAPIIPIMTTSYYENGWYQVWDWFRTGGIIFGLITINLAFGTGVAEELQNGAQRLRFLRLHQVNWWRLVTTRWLSLIAIPIVSLVAATGLFLGYSLMRTGLGDLRYPVQHWITGPPWDTLFNDVRLREAMNYFAPLRIELMPLSRYLLLAGTLLLAIICLNAAIILLVSRIVKQPLVTQVLSALWPFLIFLPINAHNPFSYLNIDTSATNYIATVVDTTQTLYWPILGSIFLAALLILGVVILWRPAVAKGVRK